MAAGEGADDAPQPRAHRLPRGGAGGATRQEAGPAEPAQPATGRPGPRTRGGECARRYARGSARGCAASRQHGTAGWGWATAWRWRRVPPGRGARRGYAQRRAAGRAGRSGPEVCSGPERRRRGPPGGAPCWRERDAAGAALPSQPRQATAFDRGAGGAHRSVLTLPSTLNPRLLLLLSRLQLQPRPPVLSLSPDPNPNSNSNPYYY